jgi:hypothetical protein
VVPGSVVGAIRAARPADNFAKLNGKWLIQDLRI